MSLEAHGSNDGCSSNGTIHTKLRIKEELPSKINDSNQIVYNEHDASIVEGSLKTTADVVKHGSFDISEMDSNDLNTAKLKQTNNRNVIDLTNMTLSDAGNMIKVDRKTKNVDDSITLSLNTKDMNALLLKEVQKNSKIQVCSVQSTTYLIYDDATRSLTTVQTAQFRVNFKITSTEE